MSFGIVQADWPCSRQIQTEKCSIQLGQSRQDILFDKRRAPFVAAPTQAQDKCQGPFAEKQFKANEKLSLAIHS